MYALIDCNNFYASCERLFRPDLRDKPVVALSNNDGCVIARSNEAKALGIKMGQPFYQIKALCQHQQVAVFSSNYTLYGDISHRVMTTIENSWPALEIYSIDEAFLDLSTLPFEQQTAFCIVLQKKILKEVGIPTSIGIGATKTLAKAANYLCKKVLKIPVFHIEGHRPWLEKIPCGEVWGIGRQWRMKLRQEGIHTAADLAACNPHQLKQRYNVILMSTAMELGGIPCHTLEDSVPRKNICSSKSFGQMQTEFEPLAQAVSSYCARAWEKLRRQGSVAQQLSVFVQTNRFRADLPQYNKQVQYRFVNPTDDLMLITKMAKRCLAQLYRGGYQYKKAGVCLEELRPKTAIQLDLFHQPANEVLAKKEQLMTVFEQINQRYGRQIVRLGAEGYSRPWAMWAELKSPAYTTKWSDLAIVKS